MQQTQLMTNELGAAGSRITRVGFRGPDQVDPILAAAGVRLTALDLAKIEDEKGRRAA